MDKLKKAMLRAENQGKAVQPRPQEDQPPLREASPPPGGVRQSHRTPHPEPTADRPPLAREAGPQPRQAPCPVQTPRPTPVRDRPLPRRAVRFLPPVGQAAEALGELQTQVLTRLCGAGGSSVLVTSAHPGEGKTFTAAHLAAGLASGGKRPAVLVDANLGAPSVARSFGIPEQPGLAEYLRGKADLGEVLIESGQAGLVLLPAGDSGKMRRELFRGERMGEALRQLRSLYPGGLFVLDGPSLLHETDAAALAAVTDAVLLVVEAHATPESDLVRASRALGAGQRVGIVYNGCPG